MFLPGQDSVVGNLKCHLFQPVPGVRSPCVGAHIFFPDPTQVQQYQHQQSLVGGRRRQQGEAAGGGRRRRQQKEAAVLTPHTPASSAT